MNAWLRIPALLAPTLMAVLDLLDLLERGGVRSPEPLEPRERARPAMSGSDPAGPTRRPWAAQGRTEAG